MTTNSPLNIIFAGTPAFAAVALEGLLHSSHHIKAVYTQPDRPAGRGQKLTASPVKEIALKYNVPILQPASLKNPEEQKYLRDLNADLMIVAAYGLILPKAILEATRLGCINIHPSLLPRFRGAAPIQRAILAGDKKTGITIMQMNEGLDTGPMLYKTECEITEQDTSKTLHDKLAVLGKETLLTALEKLSSLNPEPQNDSLATYAHKISKEEAKLDWNLSAEELNRKIRGFNPWPVAYCALGDKILRVWEAQVIKKEINETPGKILHTSRDGIDIATGKNILRLLKLQLPSGRVLSATEILNAHQHDFAAGKIL
jgi:methionyl-tRNA formyltransferase